MKPHMRHWGALGRDMHSGQVSLCLLSVTFCMVRSMPGWWLGCWGEGVGIGALVCLFLSTKYFGASDVATPESSEASPVP